MNLSACINMRYAQIHEKGVENVSQLITELLASRQNSAPKKKTKKLSWLNLFDRWEERCILPGLKTWFPPRTWGL